MFWWQLAKNPGFQNPSVSAAVEECLKVVAAAAAAAAAVHT